VTPAGINTSPGDSPPDAYDPPDIGDIFPESPLPDDAFGDADHRKGDYDLVLDMDVTNQLVQAREGFSFRIPEGTFAIKKTSDAPLDQQPDIKLKATLASGAPLPEWLYFDAETATFSGVCPENVSLVDVKVIASTDDGQETQAAFSIVVRSAEEVVPQSAGGADVPQEGQQTPAQGDDQDQDESGEDVPTEDSAVSASGIAAGLSFSVAGSLTRSRYAGIAGSGYAESCDFETQRRQLLQDLGL
jgi:hypothetical protein